jgi:hypothetical protein
MASVSDHARRVGFSISQLTDSPPPAAGQDTLAGDVRSDAPRKSGSQWTRRWRGVNSNFQYAGAMNLVVAPFLTLVRVDGLARSERGTAVPRVCPASCETVDGHPECALFDRTHVSDACGRERQLVRHRSERGQSVADGVGHRASDDRIVQMQRH